MNAKYSAQKKLVLKFVCLIMLLGLFSVSSFAREEVGSDSLHDSLYPLLGNGGYDVQHYNIDLVFNPLQNYIAGATTIEAVAEQNLSAFNLDLFGLDIQTITVNNVEAAFYRDGTELTVIPDSPIVAGETFIVIVNYSGVPEPIDDEGVPFVRLGWQEWSPGYFAATSEPSGSMNWFPSNNHPQDKATFTFQITVPPPNVVVANGILREVIENSDTRTYIWDMNNPMATYLAIVAVGDFVEVRDDSGSVPIRNYFPPDIDESFIDAHSKTGKMISYLSNLLGDYPFEVYGVIVVPGFSSALETQSLSIFGDYHVPAETGVIHELTHQWFGDSVTVADWRDIWLHEGFATYFEALWTEATEGEDSFRGFVIDYMYDFASENESPAPYITEVQDLFSRTVYVRGALVLHALRGEVGDEVFFEILRTFYENYAYSTATSEDFIAVAESVSGRDLGSLFDTWLFGANVPKLPDNMLP